MVSETESPLRECVFFPLTEVQVAASAANKTSCPQGWWEGNPVPHPFIPLSTGMGLSDSYGIKGFCGQPWESNHFWHFLWGTLFWVLNDWLLNTLGTPPTCENQGLPSWELFTEDPPGSSRGSTVSLWKCAQVLHVFLANATIVSQVEINSFIKCVKAPMWPGSTSTMCSQCWGAQSIRSR